MPHQFRFESESLDATDRLGVAIGNSVAAGTLLGLTGTLGAGKTRLTRAIGIGLEAEPANIVSPTFTIMVPHAGRLDLIHMDAYRIGSDEEVDELGLDELIVDGAVLVVEWAERIESLLPRIDVNIAIEHTGDVSRRFDLTGRTEAGGRLVQHVETALRPERDPSA